MFSAESLRAAGVEEPVVELIAVPSDPVGGVQPETEVTLDPLVDEVRQFLGRRVRIERREDRADVHVRALLVDLLAQLRNTGLQDLAVGIVPDAAGQGQNVVDSIQKGDELQKLTIGEG